MVGDQRCLGAILQLEHHETKVELFVKTSAKILMLSSIEITLERANRAMEGVMNTINSKYMSLLIYRTSELSPIRRGTLIGRLHRLQATLMIHMSASQHDQWFQFYRSISALLLSLNPALILSIYIRVACCTLPFRF
jgi:hypothetical protein